MREDMKIVRVHEGKTTIEVPDPSSFRTAAGDYAPSLARVFYNPAMEFCRDMSVSAAQVFARKSGGLRVSDPLAGVGVRGIRYAKEVDGVSKVVANDRLSEAYEFIRRNVEINEVREKVEARNVDANILLLEKRGQFNFIDIDPFGSPAPYLEAACEALSRSGMLAMTATDTAPLSGTHVHACVRRYGAVSFRTEYGHELGIRILIGFAQRLAGKHDLALVPVFSHSTIHYFRIYLEARRGAQRVDETLKQQGYVSHCATCLRRTFSIGLLPRLPSKCECGGTLSHSGPMWLGKIVDRRFARDMAQDIAGRNFRQGYAELALINRCAEEAEGPPTFYDLNILAGRARVPPPKMAAFIARLRALGFFASRTHFSDIGLRTDAPMDEVHKLLNDFRVAQHRG